VVDSDSFQSIQDKTRLRQKFMTHSDIDNYITHKSLRLGVGTIKGSGPGIKSFYPRLKVWRCNSPRSRTLSFTKCCVIMKFLVSLFCPQGFSMHPSKNVFNMPSNGEPRL